MYKLTDLTYSKVTHKIFISSLNIYPGETFLQSLLIDFSPIEAAYMNFRNYTPTLPKGRINRGSFRYFTSLVPLGILFRLIYSFFEKVIFYKYYKYSIYEKRKNVILDFIPLRYSKRIGIYPTSYNNFLPLEIFFIALISLVR